MRDFLVFLLLAAGTPATPLLFIFIWMNKSFDDAWETFGKVIDAAFSD